MKNITMYTPLEQFEIKIIQPLSFFGYFDMSLTTISLYSALIVGILFSFMWLSIYKATIIPRNWQSVVELLYNFVFDMIKQQVGYKGEGYFPIFFTTFLFIMGANLIGLLPFGVTVTAHIIITFSLALSFNLGFLIAGFANHGIKFLKLFVPSGAPMVLVPLIVVIEIVSYCIRTFSLSLRLFANMLAGHTLLHILASFAVKFWKSNLYLVALFPFILIIMITVLEFGIALLQAYVFTILLCIYLNDAMHPGH